VALAWVEVGLGLLFSFLGSRALFLQDWQSLRARFLIVCGADGYEVLGRDSWCCELFRMLSLGPIGVCMSDWRLVEHKGVCCLMFS
jgi:hypothetical protein